MKMVMSGRTDTEIKTIINEHVYSGIEAKNTIRFLEKGRIKK